jgi:hypothetical protein
MLRTVLLALSLWALVGGSLLSICGLSIHPCAAGEHHEGEAEEDHKDPVCDNLVALFRPAVRAPDGLVVVVVLARGFGDAAAALDGPEAGLQLQQPAALHLLPYHPSDRPLLN